MPALQRLTDDDVRVELADRAARRMLDLDQLIDRARAECAYRRIEGLEAKREEWCGVRMGLLRDVWRRRMTIEDLRRTAARREAWGPTPTGLRPGPPLLRDPAVLRQQA